MVRREEAAWDPTAWVVLDSRAGVHPVAGKVSPSFEALVSAAASIGTRLVRDGYAVGLVDAEGASHHVAADRPDGEDSWLDPLIDVALTGAPDLLEATATLSRVGGEHLVVALLGGLDRSIADALASAAGARETRIALALAPTPDGQPDWDAGAALLADHGWTVRSLPGGGDALAAAWAEQGALR